SRSAGIRMSPISGSKRPELPSTRPMAVSRWTAGQEPRCHTSMRSATSPIAIREGHAFADTVFGKRPVRVDHSDIPTAVFSQPEVATVGLTETEARAQFGVVDIYKTDFRPIKSTMSGRDTRILMKLVVDGTTDRVVGCHVVGDTAAEIVQAVGIAVKMKATKADFDATFA